MFECLNFRIITQQLLSWWPHIDLLYNKSAELRAMFIDTLTKVTQGYISHTPLRMIQVLDISLSANLFYTLRNWR